MKRHLVQDISPEAWQSLQFSLWGKAPYAKDGSTIDDIIPEEVYTRKEGLEIFGTCWFLGGTKDPTKCPFHLLMKRPTFNSTQSLTKKNIKSAQINKFEFDNRTLKIEIS